MEGLEEIVRAPDQLVLGCEVDPFVIAAMGENPPLIEVALDQRGHRGLGGGLVARPLTLLRGQCGQLQQRRGSDGRARGIPGGVWPHGRVEVPKGNTVDGRMGQPPVCRARRHVEEVALLRPQIHDCIAHHSPGLGADPGAVVADSLVSVTAEQVAGLWVEGGRLADRAVSSNTELDMPVRMAHRHIAQAGVPELRRRPDQERGTLNAVDAGLAAPDVGGLFGLGAERQDARLRVEAGGQALRPLEGDVACQGVGEKDRAEEGTVVEEEAPKDGVRVSAWAQPFGPVLGPVPVAGLSGVVGGQPAHTIPEASRPVPTGRSGPLTRGGIAIVREAVGDALAGVIDPAEEPLQPVLPRGACHAVLLPAGARLFLSLIVPPCIQSPRCVHAARRGELR